MFCLLTHVFGDDVGAVDCDTAYWTLLCRNLTEHLIMPEEEIKSD